MSRDYPNIRRFIDDRDRRIARTLPKATWLHLEWAPAILPDRPFVQRNRLANAVRLRIGSLIIIHRARRLLDSARALHPEAFRSSNPRRTP